MNSCAARHPFLDRDSIVVNADYVTMESGTGCVHIAPGFGADDYITCRKYNIDIIVPVDDRGYQTEGAGKFAGMYYEDSNKAILDDMCASGVSSPPKRSRTATRTAGAVSSRLYSARRHSGSAQSTPSKKKL